MTDIAPRHDDKTTPNRRYPLRFATHRKRVDASEGKGGQPSDASADGGMVTLLPGESVTWSISSDADVDPQRFAAANVLRSANDLKR